MSIQEFYFAIGGDYDAIRGRFGSDERIEKFVNMFFMDKSYENLLASLNDGDLATAFRCAHTIKGNAKNVSFQALVKSSTELTEALRLDDEGVSAAPEKIPELLESVRSDMDVVFAARREHLIAGE